MGLNGFDIRGDWPMVELLRLHGEGNGEGKNTLESKFSNKDFQERFWNRFRESSAGCWEWHGSKRANGYGTVHIRWLPGHKRALTISVHRLAYILTKGQPPINKPFVLHHCNNRACGNPNHLYTGTQKDNIQQATKQNRMDLSGLWWRSGTVSPSQKFSDATITKIRAQYLAGTKRRQIEKQFGIGHSQLWNITHGRSRKVRLSQEAVVPLRLPPVIRVHQLTRYWYCDEETRGRVMEGWQAERPFGVALTEGSNFHDWMENRPRTKGETILNDKLEQWKREHEFGWYEKAARELYRPIYYDYGDGTPPAEIKVVCHPDNLRVISEDRKFYTQVEEYKTVARLEKLPDGTYGYPFFKRSQAEFQTQLYRWALGWVLPQIQESAHNDLILSIHKRPGGYLLKEYHFAYMGDAAIEAQIQWIFDGWTLRRDPLVPQRWKCDRCDPGFKSNCRIAKSNWTFGKIP